MHRTDELFEQAVEYATENDIYPDHANSNVVSIITYKHNDNVSDMEGSGHITVIKYKNGCSVACGWDEMFKERWSEEVETNSQEFIQKLLDDDEDLIDPLMFILVEGFAVHPPTYIDRCIEEGYLAGPIVRYQRK